MANRTISRPGAAASSSCTASSSASTSYSNFDVFINHRGPDVKDTFALHLYRRLTSNQLTVFLDREELEEGHNISSQIEQAICGASVHIAIFSQNYAQSRWCLDELVLMVNSGATILPVFYKIDPREVRWTVKEGAYAEALRQLEKKTTYDSETGKEKPRHSPDTIQSWRRALSHVADIKGFVYGDKDDERELLDNVVKSVLKKVPKPPLYVAKHPTGLNLKLEEFEETVLSKQETQRVEAKVVGIVGMGGAGKTTLAKAFFNLRKSDYNQSSFLFDVRETIRSMGVNTIRSMGVNYLLSKLIKDLTGRDIRIESRDEGIGILRKYLSSCHALIVLDDIDNVSQLEALLPIRDILSPDSLILATSRNKHVLTSSGVSESSIYKLKGLNGQHSEELFCSYAFNKPFPSPEFAKLAGRFIRACDGLPLSLKVFGALVSGQNESYWEEILNELDKILPTTEIQEVLKISYDSLSSNDRQIFLDIACFFLGKDRDVAISIWGLVGFQNLEDKCLLEVEFENRIKMHDHIRDLGRHISQGVMPRRLWQPTIKDGTNDIDDLLKQSSREITQVRGITMLGSNYWQASSERHLVNATTSSSERHLVNATRSCGISNLQLLAAEDGYYVERILKKVRSPHLRWLRWYNCPYTCLPSWTPMEKLRVLEVGGSRLKTLWQHESRAPLQLRQLIIHAPLFSNFPKFIGQLKYLQKIYINGYYGVALKSLPEEFGDLRSLKVLYLRDCLGMKSLPDSFGKLTNLQDISLLGSSLQMLPNSFGKLTRLKRLDLSNCFDLTISSVTLGNITTLEYLNIAGCRSVTKLPTRVAHQRSLKELLLSGANLKELPSEIGNLCNFEVLSIGNELFEVLPPLLSYIKSLKYLSIDNSPRLKCLPDHFSSLIQLEELVIYKCGIEYLPQDLPKMNNLRVLRVSECPLLELPFKKIEEERETSKELNKLESVHDNDKSMFGLTELELWGTETSEVFFAESVCPNLWSLNLRVCRKLTRIGGLCGLSKLQQLGIVGCERLEELPNIEMLISLEALSVGCVKLKSIPGLGQLRKLRRLSVIGCPEIVELSGAKHLMLLKHLDAYDCPKLRWDKDVLEELRQRLKEGLMVPGARDCPKLRWDEGLDALEEARQQLKRQQLKEQLRA